MIQFLSNQQQLKTLGLQFNHLPSNYLVQAISVVENTSSVNTLEKLYLNGNYIEGEDTWQSLATLIDRAPNLVKLHIRRQRQKRKIKIEVQIAENKNSLPSENPFFKGSAFQSKQRNSILR